MSILKIRKVVFKKKKNRKVYMVGLFVYKNDYLLFPSGNDRHMNIYNRLVFLIVMEKL